MNEKIQCKYLGLDEKGFHKILIPQTIGRGEREDYLSDEPIVKEAFKNVEVGSLIEIEASENEISVTVLEAPVKETKEEAPKETPGAILLCVKSWGSFSEGQKYRINIEPAND